MFNIKEPIRIKRGNYIETRKIFSYCIPKVNKNGLLSEDKHE